MAKVKARFSQLVMPNDLNNIGTLFGGKMVSWMDIAAAKAGQRFLRGATVMAAGKSSLTVGVAARAENSAGETRDVCEAVFTMVAVRKGKDGKWEKVSHGKSLD
jgi:acyl-CoA hydrolase